MPKVKTEDHPAYGSSPLLTEQEREIVNKADSILTRLTIGRADLYEIKSPDTTRQFLRMRLQPLESEHFCVLWLDNRHRVLTFEDLFQGTVDGAPVYPREVVRSALRWNAVAAILVHNHPSGQTEPSRADTKITQQIKDALRLIEVRLLDHLIVGDDIFSFAEHGLI